MGGNFRVADNAGVGGNGGIYMAPATEVGMRKCGCSRCHIMRSRAPQALFRLISKPSDDAELVQRWISPGDPAGTLRLNWTDSLFAGLNRLTQEQRLRLSRR